MTVTVTVPLRSIESAVNSIIRCGPAAVATSTLPTKWNPVMFAVPAVSTAVASDATRPDGSAAFFGVPDGLALGLAVPDFVPAPAGELVVGLADDPGNGRPSEGVGMANDGPGAGVAEEDGSGKQMMPRMHPWPARGAAMAGRAPVTPTRATAAKTDSVAAASSRLMRPPPILCPRRACAFPARPRVRRRKAPATRRTRAHRR